MTRNSLVQECYQFGYTHLAYSANLDNAIAFNDNDAVFDLLRRCADGASRRGRA
ncbi:MAG: hypothetical protein ACRD4L_11460 [Pyrinomonadaceae bacterium]